MTLRTLFSSLLVLSLVVFNFHLAFAGVLTTPRIYMNRQKANQASGQTFEIFFTPATNISGGAGANEIRLIFPDADDTKWCRTTGSLTVTDITDPEGGTESATNLPGTEAGTCAQGSGSGSAESNSDRLLITAVDNLTAGTKYGFKVVANTAALGTAAGAANNIKVEIRLRDNSTQIDSGTLALSLISDDQVVVTAVVDVTLSVSLNTNTAALGTLDSTHVNQAGVISTVSTSAAGGYISLAKYDQTLTSGSNTIPNTAGGTIVAGESEFGASSSDTTGAANALADWSPTTCATTTSTSNATALSTSFQDYASNAAAVTNEATTICFEASTSATQAPGTYTSTATLVTTGRF